MISYYIIMSFCPCKKNTHVRLLSDLAVLCGCMKLAVPKRPGRNGRNCASKIFVKMEAKDGNAFAAGMNTVFDKAGKPAAGKGR